MTGAHRNSSQRLALSPALALSRVLPALAVGLACSVWAPLSLAQDGPPDDDFERQPTADPVADPAADPAVQQRPMARRPGVHPASSAYLTVSPGLVQIPLNGDNVGYQWGLGAGYMVRTDGLFAIGLGINFEHGIGDLGMGEPYVSPTDHQFRAQFEATPGIELVNGKLFLHAILGVGYSALLQRWERPDTIEAIAFHGVGFSPGVGLSYQVFDRVSVGAQFGANLQWLELRDDTFTAHNMDVKLLLGWMF